MLVLEPQEASGDLWRAVPHLLGFLFCLVVLGSFVLKILESSRKAAALPNAVRYAVLPPFKQISRIYRFQWMTCKAVEATSAGSFQGARPARFLSTHE